MKRSTATATWLLLLAATVLSWWISGSPPPDTALAERTTEHTTIIALAALKMYAVMAVFMGLVRAPIGWHLYSLAVLLAIAGVMLFLLVAP